MAATAIFLHFRPHRHRRFVQNVTSSVRFYSSNDDNDQNRNSPSRPQYSFSDVKNSLKTTRNPNPSTREDSNQKVVSLEEIRNNLSKFRRELPDQPPQSARPVVSFQELYQRNATLKADTGSGTESGVKGQPDKTLQAIKMSLKSIRSNVARSQAQPGVGTRRLPLDDIELNFKPRPKSLNELPSDSTGKGNASNEAKIEFAMFYSYGDMGEKLRRLRPANKKVKFSLEELNERLQKVREMGEKEISAGRFGPLREGLIKLHTSGQEKKKPVQKISVLADMGEISNYSAHPPKEVLVEKYFHPDHMSSAEKQKLELKKVRDKFKISESDCGSARVQVAQLTTKIKHLATALHKKDKHSRKGLQAMVQKRKKLLKYLRRTDWDSYCFCLSELGLRDSADYKA
ncbi:putative ribosomal protein S15 [Helianthus annuus]|nr:putative ribosomal protein S15 [Helianthus annuus]KAJ0458769.1 putative ribosomal protein S15 [Helianthus annuus]KAJ0819400.1 putative ribosomal protein S15 [Helianthus annuus]